MFRLRTLGGAALERDGVRLDTVGAQRKSLALLTLLAVARGQGISRERVAAFLWAESDTERARGALKQALHALRRQLGSGEAVLGTAELRLNPVYIESDVGAFLEALEGGRLEDAAALYGGPFLDGFHLPRAPEFEQWVSAQRDDLAQRYASTLERLAAAAEGRGDPHAAVPWLRRLLATDPLSARATLRLMRALDAAGERVAALRCAQVHQSLLREELDSPPDPQVAALAEALRAEPAHHGERRVVPPPPQLTAGADAAAPGTPDPAEGAGPEPRDVRGRNERWRHVGAALVALVTIAAVALTLARRQGAGPAPYPPRDRSVAVLPFASRTGDAETRHLSSAVANDLTTALGRVRGLRVAPRTTTDALARERVDVRAIADTLGVATVLDGEIWRAGDRLKVAARLVEVRSDRELWAGEYDREVRDILTIEAEVVRAVAAALRGQQPLDGGARSVALPTSDVEAYELFLRARHSWLLPSQDRLQQAERYYQAAIARDPGFAMAYAGLAETYANLSNFGILEFSEALARALRAADRALELDPQLAEAHAAKAFVLASSQDFAAAEDAFERAIQLNPGYAWARHYYSLLLLMLGRTEEALEQNRLALAADALSLPANATRGIILLQRGDHAEAERELQQALALSPGYPLTQYYLAVLLAAQRRYREAGPLLEQAARSAQGTAGFTGVPGARALVLQRTGRPAAADSLIRQVEAQARAGGQRARTNLAFAHAVLGRPDAAFALFDQVQWDVPSLIDLRANPLLEPMRADPRYPVLLRRIGVEP